MAGLDGRLDWVVDRPGCEKAVDGELDFGIVVEDGDAAVLAVVAHAFGAVAVGFAGIVGVPLVKGKSAAEVVGGGMALAFDAGVVAVLAVVEQGGLHFELVAGVGNADWLAFGGEPVEGEVPEDLCEDACLGVVGAEDDFFGEAFVPGGGFAVGGVEVAVDFGAVFVELDFGGDDYLLAVRVGRGDAEEVVVGFA